MEPPTSTALDYGFAREPTEPATSALESSPQPGPAPDSAQRSPPRPTTLYVDDPAGTHDRRLAVTRPDPRAESFVLVVVLARNRLHRTMELRPGRRAREEHGPRSWMGELEVDLFDDLPFHERETETRNAFAQVFEIRKLPACFDLGRKVVRVKVAEAEALERRHGARAVDHASHRAPGGRVVAERGARRPFVRVVGVQEGHLGNIGPTRVDETLDEDLHAARPDDSQGRGPIDGPKVARGRLRHLRPRFWKGRVQSPDVENHLRRFRGEHATFGVGPEQLHGTSRECGAELSFCPPSGRWIPFQHLRRFAGGMKRTAKAVWHGTLKEGKGNLSTESGVVKNVAYLFTNRFENTPGTNPEELIAAAHAGCFSMAFANHLAAAGLTPDTIETGCAITFEKETTGWTLKESALTVKARVPGATKAQVEEQAQAAKKNCPVSRALNLNVSLSLTVEETGQTTTAQRGR